MPPLTGAIITSSGGIERAAFRVAPSWRQRRAAAATLLVTGLRAAGFAARFDASREPDAQAKAASRPALRISSENSLLPAMRAITTVPIRVARMAAASLRPGLRGASGIG